jgi:hypothetical protein
MSRRRIAGRTRDNRREQPFLSTYAGQKLGSWKQPLPNASIVLSNPPRIGSATPGRWHDNRHTLITELAESGAGDEVIIGIAGHVSRAMLSRYSVRMEAKRRARRDRRTPARSRRETPAGGRTAAAGCGGGDWLSFADRIVSVTQPILLWCFDPHQ